MVKFNITAVEKENKEAFVALTEDKKLAGQMTYSKAGDRSSLSITLGWKLNLAVKVQVNN